MAARWGLWGGLLAFVAMLLLPEPAGMSPAAWRTTAIIVLMASWWMTEALPLTATALVPFLAFPLLGIMTASDSAAPRTTPRWCCSRYNTLPPPIRRRRRAVSGAR